MTWSGRSVFSLSIALLMAFMVVLSFDYGFKARLFPAALGSLMFVMALMQFLVDTFPAARNKLSFVVAKGVSFESGGMQRDGGEPAAAKPARTAPSWKTVFGVFAALTAFTVLLAYTSFVVAVPAFLLLFVWLAAKESFAAALGLAVGVTAFLYVILRVILQSTF